MSLKHTTCYIGIRLIATAWVWGTTHPHQPSFFLVGCTSFKESREMEIAHSSRFDAHVESLCAERSFEAMPI